MHAEVVGLAVIESLGRGGAEQQLVWLVPALRRRHCRIEVVALWPPYDLACELEREGVIVSRPGQGSFVSDGTSAIQKQQRVRILENRIGELFVQAYHFQVPPDELHSIIERVATKFDKEPPK